VPTTAFVLPKHVGGVDGLEGLIRRRRLIKPRNLFRVKRTGAPRASIRSMVSDVDAGTAAILKPPHANVSKPIHT